MFAPSGCKSAGNERQIQQSVAAKINIFLIGMLCGVMIAAAFTYAFAIPANNYQWKTEIWRRGGAEWTFDRNGHAGWKWIVEPIPDTPHQKPVTLPPSAVKVHSEQL
jgi:hypothetical protein